LALAQLAVAASIAAGVPVRTDDAEPASGPRYEVGEMIVTFTDTSRRVRYRGARYAVPRRLETVIRYPATGDPARFDVFGAPPAKGPFPLVVFAHGYDITPSPYARLLRAWARAGYVVAAPIFPLSSSSAPGGANEADLVNQPTDMSFVITRMLAASAATDGALAVLINPTEVAVSGQSDGGSTALAAAYNSHYVDHRIRAAVILAGAEIPGVGAYTFPAPSPPLLASQGTADVVNVPASTYQFFGIASRPKLLLSLLGAPHLGPYTTEQPQLGIVERTTVAFLDRYLKQRPGAGWRMWNAGDVRGLARLTTRLWATP
jgi:predicted dienelactone hydrolase